MEGVFDERSDKADIDKASLTDGMIIHRTHEQNAFPFFARCVFGSS